MEEIIEQFGVHAALLNEQIIENDEAIQELDTKIALIRRIIDNSNIILVNKKNIIETYEMMNQQMTQVIQEKTQEIELLKKRIADAKKAKGINAPVETTTELGSNTVDK
ncbi:unnamed protein product [Caenorhabditis brenneri]